MNTDKAVDGQVQNPWANPNLTMGEAYDLHIKHAREHVEAMCVKKAKLEAMNLLSHPYRQMRELLEMHSF